MNRQSSLVFNTEIEWQGENRGAIRSSKLPDLLITGVSQLSDPEGLWSPEQLLVASVNASFMAAFMQIARNSNLGVISYRCTANGVFGRDLGSRTNISQLILRPVIVIRSAVDVARAQKILDEAEVSYNVSDSIRTIVKLRPQVFHRELPVSPCPPMFDKAPGSD